ncbi:hypothetical protein Pint_22550 [Pistacia integerrima]|uniref:Uncharacterized protein n=1 Tax=Pistacia integerrima TaxID=434235 RepID=A0ACC0YMD8_9ROSI|nr:hypothetical protein Pint_22550 [Pistacia integerrima]
MQMQELFSVSHFQRGYRLSPTLKFHSEFQKNGGVLILSVCSISKSFFENPSLVF